MKWLKGYKVVEKLLLEAIEQSRIDEHANTRLHLAFETALGHHRDQMSIGDAELFELHQQIMAMEDECENQQARIIGDGQQRELFDRDVSDTLTRMDETIATLTLEVSKYRDLQLESQMDKEEMVMDQEATQLESQRLTKELQELRVKAQESSDEAEKHRRTTEQALLEQQKLQSDVQRITEEADGHRRRADEYLRQAEQAVKERDKVQTKAQKSAEQHGAEKDQATRTQHHVQYQLQQVNAARSRSERQSRASVARSTKLTGLLRAAKTAHSGLMRRFLAAQSSSLCNQRARRRADLETASVLESMRVLKVRAEETMKRMDGKLQDCEQVCQGLRSQIRQGSGAMQTADHALHHMMTALNDDHTQRKHQRLIMTAVDNFTASVATDFDDIISHVEESIGRVKRQSAEFSNGPGALVSRPTTVAPTSSPARQIDNALTLLDEEMLELIKKLSSAAAETAAEGCRVSSRVQTLETITRDMRDEMDFVENDNKALQERNAILDAQVDATAGRIGILEDILNEQQALSMTQVQQIRELRCQIEEMRKTTDEDEDTMMDLARRLSRASTLVDSAEEKNVELGKELAARTTELDKVLARLVHSAMLLHDLRLLVLSYEERLALAIAIAGPNLGPSRKRKGVDTTGGPSKHIRIA